METFATGVTLPASAAAGAGLNLGNGVAPSAPVAGDVWLTATDLLYRVGATTKTVVPTLRQVITTGGSLTGGGDLGADRTLALSGDSGTPGNSKYYGTDGSGTKGYFTLPGLTGYDQLSTRVNADVSITAITTLTSSAFGKWHSIGATGDYTITLPDPTSYAGQFIGFRCDGTFDVPTRQVSIDPAGTDTIFGRSSGQALILLKTNTLVLMANGAGKWTIVEAVLDTAWLDGGAIGLTAVSGGLVKGTTVRDRVSWRRINDSQEVRWHYSQSGAGTAGTGDYLLAVPLGTMDSTFHPVRTTSISGGAQVDDAIAYAVPGAYGHVGNSTNSDHVFAVVPYSTTQVRLAVVRASGSTYDAWGSTEHSVANATESVHVSATVKMTDW